MPQQAQPKEEDTSLQQVMLPQKPISAPAVPHLSTIHLPEGLRLHEISEKLLDLAQAKFEEILLTYVKNLGSKDFETRELSDTTLRRFGRFSVELLLKLKDSPLVQGDKEIQRRVMHILEDLQSEFVHPWQTLQQDMLEQILESKQVLALKTCLRAYLKAETPDDKKAFTRLKQ